MRPPPPAAVVETHVSVLHFHDDLVVKFKKPVRFPFLDFTAVEARRAACEAEVAANRRLSPDVYLGVAALTLGAQVLDHAVVMRRLPADRSLGALVRGGAADALHGDMTRLAGVLARFHDRAERSEAIDADARPEALRRTWRHSLDAIGPFAGTMVDGDLLGRVEALAMGYLAGRAPLFERRIAEGRICDGHGDLLADDVFLLDDGPRLLDCVEFDPRLRHVDVVADLAFLVMDLEFLGAAGLAGELLEAYEEASAERVVPSLVHHYVAQRAMVRAEVACLRAEQAGDETGGGGRAGALTALALEHLEAGRVVCGVVSGLPGTGKTSLARAAARSLGWPVLCSDEIRRDLVAPGWRGPLRADALPGAYSDEVTTHTYAILLARARTMLGQGRSVLIDATFADPRWRRAVLQLARETVSDPVVLSCQAPAGVVAARLRARLAEGHDLSGADGAVARAMAAGTETWAEATPIDTAAPLGSATTDALRLLGGGAGRRARRRRRQGRSSSAKRRAVTARPARPMAAR